MKDLAGTRGRSAHYQCNLCKVLIYIILQYTTLVCDDDIRRKQLNSGGALHWSAANRIHFH